MRARCPVCAAVASTDPRSFCAARMAIAIAWGCAATNDHVRRLEPIPHHVVERSLLLGVSLKDGRDRTHRPERREGSETYEGRHASLSCAVPQSLGEPYPVRASCGSMEGVHLSFFPACCQRTQRCPRTRSRNLRATIGKLATVTRRDRCRRRPG
jgi:hypothetical protein